MVGGYRRLLYPVLLLAAVYAVGRTLSLDQSTQPPPSPPDAPSPAPPTHPTPAQEVTLQHLISAPKQLWNDKEGRYRRIAHARLRQLAACLARGDCHPNADKIVVFASNFCHWALADRDAIPGGEQVWCQAMRDSFERSGFTLINAGRRTNVHFLLELHREVGDHIVWILGDEGIKKDGRGVIGDVVKSADLTDGIPAWKWFQFNYFPSALETLVGPASWRANAEPPSPLNVTVEWKGDAVVLHTEYDTLRVWSSEGELEDNPPPPKQRASKTSTYVGFDLPDDFAVTPWSDRPNRIWVLAKYPRYFSRKDAAWPAEFYTKAHEELSKEFDGFEFVGAIHAKDPNQDNIDDVPSVIRNVGRKGPDEFDQELKQCKGLLGVGWPLHSPTPYRSLAMGVAFINPHGLHNKNTPPEQRHDKTKWDQSQHMTMKGVPEPWVYQAEEARYEDFVGSLRKALSTPTRPARFARMSRGVYDERLAAIALHDWRREAEIAIERGIGREGLVL